MLIQFKSITLCTVLSFYAIQLKSQENKTQQESFQTDSKAGVTIEVNKNIELVSIAYFLTDLGFKKNTHCYSFLVNQYFKQHKNHKAIHHLKSFLTKKNADMGFVGLGEFISNEFKFMPELMSQDDYKYYNTLYGMENIIEFFVLLKDFKATSNYDSFYKKNESIYQEWASKFRLLLANSHTINSYQSYLKETYTWKIYLSPLYGGAHAIMRDNEYNSKNKTFIYGPSIQQGFLSICLEGRFGVRLEIPLTVCAVGQSKAYMSIKNSYLAPHRYLEQMDRNPC